MTTISSRSFNHDVSAAKRAADDGPVLITDRGAPTYVLLSVRDYEDLLADQRSVVDRLSVDDDIDLPIDPLDLTIRAADL